MHLRSAECGMGNTFSGTLEILAGRMSSCGSGWGSLHSAAEGLHPILLLSMTWLQSLIPLPGQHIWHKGFCAKENPASAECFSTSLPQCK